ncbi:MAG: hypothetical protein ACK5JE_12000 [Castellaniella sp.]|uniref:hypothetical protein n=1 Tax=Castellaniella sp. TaxID=1955812 RepID=UPI003A883F39
MRNFFIQWLERIMNIFVILGIIFVLSGGVVVLFSPQGGILKALLVWVVGAIYLVMMAGFAYLGIGIYANTRQTAQAVEKIANRDA